MRTPISIICAALIFSACDNNSEKSETDNIQNNLHSIFKEIGSNETNNSKSSKEQKLPCTEQQVMNAWKKAADEFGVVAEENRPAKYLLLDVDKDKTPEIFVTNAGFTVAMTCNSRIPKVVATSFGEFSSLAIAKDYIIHIEEDGRNADWGSKGYYHIHKSEVDYILYSSTEGDEDDSNAPATTTYSFDELFEGVGEMSADIAKGYLPKDAPTPLKEYTTWSTINQQ
ncbi:MAG: hypothetical protein MJZ41_12580 [Bacteroidaceae bacterium]|nr:hypothetical protein [Bacteroidaceae bacterium]